MMPTGIARVVRLVLTVAMIATAGFFVLRFFLGGDPGTTVTAYFVRANGLYAGDDVRVLGIKVGQIDSVTPGPTSVRVTFTVDHGIQVPADAKAAIVAPDVVTGRFVQLVPAYTHGPTLPSGAVIPLARTAVPIEWDEVRAQLTRLATSLGTRGANGTGALGAAVGTVDANLSGSAGQLHAMLHDLAQAATTLADHRGDLFATVRNLQVFIGALDRSDSAVRAFSGQLAGVSGLLAQNRANLALALSQLDDAMTSVRTFVQSNRGAVKHGIASLARLTTNLYAKQYQVQSLLHVAPTALSNFYNIIDPRYNAATGTLAIGNFDNVAQLVCRQIVATGGVVADCIKILQPLVKQMGLLRFPPTVKAHMKQVAATTRLAAPASAPAPAVTPTQQNLMGLLMPGGGS